MNKISVFLILLFVSALSISGQAMSSSNISITTTQQSGDAVVTFTNSSSSAILVDYSIVDQDNVLGRQTGEVTVPANGTATIQFPWDFSTHGDPVVEIANEEFVWTGKSARDAESLCLITTMPGHSPEYAGKLEKVSMDFLFCRKA